MDEKTQAKRYVDQTSPVTFTRLTNTFNGEGEALLDLAVDVARRTHVIAGVVRRGLTDDHLQGGPGLLVSRIDHVTTPALLQTRDERR